MRTEDVCDKIFNLEIVLVFLNESFVGSFRLFVCLPLNFKIVGLMSIYDWFKSSAEMFFVGNWIEFGMAEVIAGVAFNLKGSNYITTLLLWGSNFYLTLFV